MGQVAGQQGRARAALGIHHRDQLAARGLPRPGLVDHPAQGGQQFIRGHRLGQKIPSAGLHRQADALALLQRPADQQRRPFMGRAQQQGRQLLAPQVADPQQQQVGHMLQAVQRVGMAVTHQACAHLQIGQTLTDCLQVVEGRGIAAADQ
ncbi:hypothetical protein D9M68_831170 [compost metagenome]